MKQAMKQNDLSYWYNFVDQFFAASGVLRHRYMSLSDNSLKQYEIIKEALPRYYEAHFEGGIRNIQMVLQECREKDTLNQTTFITCSRATFIYLYEGGTQVSLFAPPTKNKK